VLFLLCSLRKLPEALGLTASISWYTHYFNTEENQDYVGPIPDISYYGVNELTESERRDFLASYKGKTSQVFDNRSLLQSYCQDDVTLLRQARQVIACCKC